MVETIKCCFMSLALIFVVTSPATIQAQNKTSRPISMEQQLLQDLFRTYDRDAHPANGGVTVAFGAKLGKITNVDEKNNVIQAQWWVKQCWTNEYLTWNSSEYGGIEVLHVHPSRVWVPDVILYNNADPKIDTAGGIEKFRTHIEIKHDGSAKWLAPAMFHSVCNMDIRFFPFDEQHCKLQFASWAYDLSKLDLTIDENETRVLESFSSKEWQIAYLKAEKYLVNYSCCPHPYPHITIKFSLVRQPFYYVINMIFPCSLIACMAFLTFLLPVESGERISLCITILMAMSIFQELTSQKLPPSSEAFFLLGIYYTVTISAIGLGLAATCVVINFYYRKTAMSYWMHTLLLGKLPEILGIERTYLKKTARKRSRVTPNPSFWTKADVELSHSNEAVLKGIQVKEEQSEETIENMKIENGNRPIDQSASSPCRSRKSTKKSQNKESSSVKYLGEEEEDEVLLWQEQWKTASRVLDRLVLIVGLLLGFGSAAAIFLQAPRIRALFW